MVIFHLMIDTETFRSRIGLFNHCKGSKGRSQKFTPYSHNIYKILTNSTSSLDTNVHDNTYSQHPSLHTHFPYFWFIYYIFIIYILVLSTSMSIRLETLFPLESTLNFSYLHTLPCFTIPSLACSHIKLLSVIVSSFIYKGIFCSDYRSSTRLSNGLCRYLSLSIFWLYNLNFLLITIVNPSLLNPGPNSLSVLYQNVQGFIPFSNLSNQHPLLDMNKIAEFRAHVVTLKPDIIALNETWLKKSISSNEILPDSQYEIFRNDRSQKSHPIDPSDPTKFRRNGGGVLLVEHKA